MKLNITKDHQGSEEHKGELFPGASERTYAYQDEPVRTCAQLNLSISGSPPQRRAGKLNQDLPEPEHDGYELVIRMHTGNSLDLKLVARRTHARRLEERNRNGFAVTHDVLVKGMSFGELVNRLFGDGAQVFHKEEAFPPRVKEAMKGCYPNTP